ncbi:hypothetical protein [Zhenhengia yiwuensis]|uniref:hypothetical protein n=1 Tax=Zhenhengia yiwuensis TaxID=2763666 RepID=UPI002A750E2C|nr:hypothetical protein [Zhenhengia yiwuensis]MDY3367675.1 hypothetical protein [Zhenhengia yiwuensis]
MRWFITDFKRGLSERSFLGAIALGILSLALGLAYYVYGQDTYTADQAFIVSQSFAMPFIAPLLASMVYSNMNMLEKDSAYRNLLILKHKGKNYTLKRWFVNNILSGIALFIPMLMLYGVCSLFSPYVQQEEIVGVMLLGFLFGFVYGSFAYSLTFVNRKRYIPIVTPQVLYLLFIYAFPYLNLEKFYPPLSFSPWLMRTHVDMQLISLELFIILGVSGVLVLGSMLYRRGETLWLQRK